MKRLALASIALAALAGAASAGTSGLSSAAEVTLEVLAPNADLSTLTPIQVHRINDMVNSDSGLSQATLKTIIAS